MPVLANQQHPPIVENGKHDHRSRMHDDVAHGLDAARLDHRVALQAKHVALIENFTLENLCASLCQFGLRWLSGTGFNLWAFAPASNKTPRLKPVPHPLNRIEILAG